MIDHVIVRRGEYQDSVRLMSMSSLLQSQPGVDEALIAMATPFNLELIADLGFSIAEPTVSPDDLIVALRAVDEAASQKALSVLDQALSGADQKVDTGWLEPPPPRTIKTAALQVGANLALISVPGPYAFVEAMEALEAGLHVMIFSNNVPLDREIALKEEAARRDLLVMGPDCGTAIIGGVGLGFANATVPGPVGIAGASGTGIQHLTCLLDEAGVGVRQALGTGSRDLTTPVGGMSTRAAITSLEADPGTELIAVVSKPPAPDVAAVITEQLAAVRKPAVTIFMGQKTIEAGAAEICARLGVAPPDPGSWLVPAASERPGWLRGLFSGGTLRDEAAMVAEPILGAIAHQPDPRRHSLVDYGDDRYTQGRPHPMIDFRLRRDALRAAARADDTALILLDVVLGYGAHPDPADQLAPEIALAASHEIPVVVALCGTRSDPQGRQVQRRRLHAAGASVFSSNAAAADFAARLTGSGRP